MTLIEILVEYQGCCASEVLDAINEIFEYPRYSWVKACLNDVPIRDYSVEKMSDLLDEINRRERAASFKYAFTRTAA